MDTCGFELKMEIVFDFVVLQQNVCSFLPF